MQDKKRSRQRAFSFMSAHRDCCSRPRDFGQMLCIEHIASFWCFRYDKQGNSPVGGKIDLVIQLRGAAEIDFQKERRNDETKTAISFLAFAMTAGLLTVGAGAAGPAYGDNAGHWAEGSIGRWSEHGIVQGSNGAFAPQRAVHLRTARQHSRKAAQAACRGKCGLCRQQAPGAGSLMPSTAARLRVSLTATAMAP